MRLKNKTALITGANKGIGRSVALAFAREGADVILVARNPIMLEGVVAEVSATGQKALAIPCDVSSAEEVRNMASEASSFSD